MDYFRRDPKPFLGGSMRKGSKIIIFLLLFFFLIRIGVAIFLGQKEIMHADSPSYNGYATAILQNNNWLTNPDFFGHWRAPFYPMFIATIYTLFGTNNFIAVYIFQAFLSVITCFFIYKISKKTFNEKVAIFSLIWSGFYIFYLMYVRLLIRETLVIFLIIIFFYHLYLYLSDENRRLRNFWLLLISYFLLIHTDPRYLFYLPFFIFLYAIYQPVKKGIKNYFVFLFMTILLVIPWTIRNYIAYDRFVLITSFSSVYIRYSIFSKGIEKVLNLEEINETISKNYPTEEERNLIKQGLNPAGRSKEELEAIRKDIYPPLTYFKRILYWLIEFWRPVRFSAGYCPFPNAGFQGKWSLRHNLSSLFCYGILLPFMFLGFYFLIKEKNKIWIFLLFPILIQSLLHVLQTAIYRYRVPIDAFIIIVAFYGLYQIYYTIKKRIRLCYD